MAQADSGMTYNEALKLVLELAENGVLSQHEADTPELVLERQRQEDALKIIKMYNALDETDCG